jgi:hypothetical protein
MEPDRDLGLTDPVLLLEDADHRSVLGRRISADLPHAVSEEHVGPTCEEEAAQAASASLRHDADVIDRAFVDSVAVGARKDDRQYETGWLALDAYKRPPRAFAPVGLPGRGVSEHRLGGRRGAMSRKSGAIARIERSRER